MTADAHGHGPDQLGRAGTELYARALKEGAVPAEDAAAAPCLIAAVHIAKLAALLGSGSRAQLGCLIGRSGILEREPGP